MRTSQNSFFKKIFLIYFLDKPGHVLSQSLHGCHPLFIVLHILLLSAQPDIPVAGPGHDHLADEKEVVDGVEDVNGPCPSHLSMAA